jgi:hypothetical protein
MERDAVTERAVGPRQSRRGFVNWLLGTSVGGLLLAALYPVTRYLIPPETAESTATTVTLSIRPEDVAPNSAQIFRFGNKPGILVRTSAGELRAFSASCTHLSCIVQYRGRVSMATLKQRFSGAWAWLDERLDLAAISKIAEKKEVPVHRHTIWYYLGGMTLFLYLIQIATGILLLFYYRPSAEDAYESVQFLMAEVHFGWLFRSIHAWSSNLMIFTAFLHLFSVLLLRAYRKPREITWISGVLLLGLAMAFGFTGYLLPWNELSYFATRVGTRWRPPFCSVCTYSWFRSSG